MSMQAVKNYFKAYGMEKEIIVFSCSSATVSLAAAALHCEEAHIAKTLALQHQDEIFVLVTAGDTRIDNKKFKLHFGFKAKMLSFDQTEQFTGHPVGGVCPFALPPSVKVYLDQSLRRFSFVYPACGSANSAIQLTCEQLEELSQSKNWLDVCRIVV